MATERIEVSLKYKGADVKNGSMAISDVIPVFQGFSGAFGRIANLENTDVEHRITLMAVRSGSVEFELIVDAVSQVAENPELLAALMEVPRLPAAYRVVEIIVGIIRLKQRKDDGTTPQFVHGGNVDLKDSHNNTVNYKVNVYNYFNRGAIDNHLDDLTKPLENDGIDAAELQARDSEGTVISQRIPSEDRPYFVAKTDETKSYEERDLIVTLDSYTKRSNKGFLYLQNGKRVPYEYVGDDATELCAMFGTYYGQVRIWCRATKQGQRGIVHVEIYDYRRVQTLLMDAE